jgi:hypothetical protein
MDNSFALLLNERQQRMYVDAIFAMAALDGFEIDCTTGTENGERPVLCAKQIGDYRIEIGWSDEADQGSDPTKAVWDVEVDEYDPASNDWKWHLVNGSTRSRCHQDRQGSGTYLALAGAALPYGNERSGCRQQSPHAGVNPRPFHFDGARRSKTSTTHWVTSRA